MDAKGFPTSADIYLELDGTKIAVVQGSTARASKSSQSVEAFGESEPVTTIPGQTKYVLELTRLYATDDAISDGISSTVEMASTTRNGLYSLRYSSHSTGKNAAAQFHENLLFCIFMKWNWER